MSGYRDEKETLRRRVAALEEQLERATDGEELGLESELAKLRSERDALLRERAQLRARTEKLEGDLEALTEAAGARLAKAHRELASTKHLRLRTSLGVLVGVAIGVGALSSLLGFLPGLGLAVILAVASMAGWLALRRMSPPPKPFDPTAEPAPERRKKIRKQRVRARVDVERQEVATRAKSRQRRRR